MHLDENEKIIQDKNPYLKKKEKNQKSCKMNVLPYNI